MDVNRMTLRQKIGQLMIFGFSGKEAPVEFYKLFEEDFVGGVILFNRNIETPDAVLKLTANLQMAAKRAGQPFPLLVSIDQENGIVRRLGNGTTEFPGNMLLAAVGDQQATRAVSQATAKELRALGINANLAPVLDVNNHPDNPVIGVRSFGEKVADVIRHGTAFIKGHHDTGVITTAKHFPGHGDTDTDSHLALPTIPHDLNRLNQIELEPFRKAIVEGVDCIMISHISFPALEPDKDVPASLSYAVVTELLRKKMGFKGVIMTDCLEMNAIAETVGTVEGAVRALRAGVDTIIVSHTYSLQKKVIQRILKAVDRGELREEAIDKAVQRVWHLKSKYLSWERVPTPEKGIPQYVGGEAHRQLAWKLYERGTTLLKNNGILPLDLDPRTTILVVEVDQKRYSLVQDGEDICRLRDAVLQHHRNVKSIHIGISPSKEEMRKVLQEVESADIIIYGTVNAHLMRSQADLVNRVSRMDKPVIAVAMHNPYDLAAIPRASAFIATYEPTFSALSVAADIIFGKKKARGKLPITIPGHAERGTGL